VFQGLRAAWRAGDEVFAEVAVPEAERLAAAGFAVHPALLDAALHAMWCTEQQAQEQGQDQVQKRGGRLPFSWRGVRVHASGATAARVRIRIVGPDAVSLVLCDADGALIASVESLTLREIPAGGLDSPAAAAVTAGSLFEVRWTPVPVPAGDPAAAAPVAVVPLAEAAQLAGPPPDPVVLAVAGGGQDQAATAHQVVGEVLAALQEWLAEPRLEDTPLLIVTCGAVGVTSETGGRAAGVDDVAAAAVWGLVRSAQSEHPGRFVLVDTDAPDALAEVVGAVLACGEPQVAIRGGVLHAARLVLLPPNPNSPNLDSPEPGGSLEPTAAPGSRWGEGWVLVTGGGGLAAVITRHLVRDCGVRHVLLASRRGPTAPGMDELAAELSADGVQVAAVACDVADRDAVAQVFDQFEVSAVIHTAGVLDDAVLASLQPGQVDAVLRPKVDGSWNLHQASLHRELAAFVVFSSAAGVLGAPGQGNYAAGNAFLDALAVYRQGLGLPGLSLAWGAWDQTTGMTARLRDQDLARLARGGFPPLTAAHGTALFDAAVSAGRPAAVPMRINRRMLAAAAAQLPPLLHALIPVTSRPAAGHGTAPAALAAQLAALPPAERTAELQTLVQAEVAAVLGHPDPAAITPARPFTELGFDSLTAVELRNRLAARTSTRLPATVIFDHPTPTELAEHLSAEIDNAAVQQAPPEPAAETAQDLVTQLYRQALADGKTAEGDEFLMSLARLRPVFRGPAELASAPAPVRLATGGTRTQLVCVPPIVPLTGDRAYYRLASAFQGNRDVSSLTPTGFRPGEQLPASPRALVAVLAEAIAGHVGQSPFALLGISSGGLVAYEIARRLDDMGSHPKAVIFVDTYAMNDSRVDEFQQEMAEEMYSRGDAAAPGAINQASLSAYVWTCSLFQDWRPEPVSFPTLLLRATEPLNAGRSDMGWQTSLDHVTTVLDVPGNHFTMANEHVASTAEVIDTWLEDFAERD
jgi:polyene macrolide polyketide synthase